MKKNRIAAIILTLAYLFLIFYLCTANLSSVNTGFLPREIMGIPIDKCIHFIMFFPLPFLSYAAIRGKNHKKSLLIAFLCCIAIACAAEFSQGLTDYRTVDKWDLAANL